MPSVFKHHGILSSEDSVLIPDVMFEETIFPKINTTDEEFVIEQEELEEDTVLPLKEPDETMEEQTKKEQPSVVKQKEPTPAFMTREELTEYYHAELEQIRRQAREDAYLEAIYRKKGELTECVQKVDKQLTEMQRLQNRFMEQYACELKYLAIEIAEKMILEKIEEDDTILKKLVLNTVNNVRNSSWMDVEISERLVNLVDCVKTELEHTAANARVTVTPMACAEDTCRVNTEEGTIVATISAQADNLRTVFQAIDKKN